MTTDRFDQPTYLICGDLRKLFAHAYGIYDPQGQLVLYAYMGTLRGFQNADIRLYTAEDRQTEVLLIQGRDRIDFLGTYDVTDAATGRKIGVLERRGFKSMVKDEWVIMDAEDRRIGVISEDSVLLALLRRFAGSLIPQTYYAEIGPTQVCIFRRNLNPLVTKLTVDFSVDRSRVLDRRLGLAAGVLLCAIEGRQS
ncbi:MAG TPA: hypothetical protein VM221_10195 [Armatimonadota bacterium]|nr:hypothetical protein [Armatimonadota bacterium]